MATVAVCGIYPTYESVDNALGRLMTAGFPRDAVSLMLPENLGAGLASHHAKRRPAGPAPNAAAVGAGVEWLNATDVVLMPEVGRMLIAGPLGAAFRGIEQDLKGIAKALIDLGLPESDAKHYEGLVRAGGILLSVHVPDTGGQQTGRSLLETTGATDIAVRGRPFGDI